MIKNLLQEGFILKQKGHYKHAIEVFYKALELDNTSSELLLELAELYNLMGNEERALNYIEQILDKNPAHIEALKLLEKIFINKNALKEAEQTAKNIYCISGNKHDLATIFKLLNQQNKFDEIFEYRIESPNAAVYEEQAKALYYKKEFAKSEELLKKALELEPYNQSIILLLGKVLYIQNKKDLCVTLLEKLVPNENNAELFNFTGLISAYTGNYRHAVDCFNSAIRLRRSYAEYYYNLANTYFKQGEIILAQKNYNLAISLQPDNNRYHFALANLYYSEKHYKKALEELNGNFFESRLLKAVILYDTGYLALARKELSALSLECPDNVILQEYKSRIDEELGLN